MAQAQILTILVGGITGESAQAVADTLSSEKGFVTVNYNVLNNTIPAGNLCYAEVKCTVHPTAPHPAVKSLGQEESSAGSREMAGRSLIQHSDIDINYIAGTIFSELDQLNIQLGRTGKALASGKKNELCLVGFSFGAYVVTALANLMASNKKFSDTEIRVVLLDQPPLSISSGFNLQQKYSKVQGFLREFYSCANPSVSSDSCILRLLQTLALSAPVSEVAFYQYAAGLLEQLLNCLTGEIYAEERKRISTVLFNSIALYKSAESDDSQKLSSNADSQALLLIIEKTMHEADTTSELCETAWRKVFPKLNCRNIEHLWKVVDGETKGILKIEKVAASHIGLLRHRMVVQTTALRMSKAARWFLCYIHDINQLPRSRSPSESSISDSASSSSASSSSSSSSDEDTIVSAKRRKLGPRESKKQRSLGVNFISQAVEGARREAQRLASQKEQMQARVVDMCVQQGRNPWGVTRSDVDYRRQVAQSVFREESQSAMYGSGHFGRSNYPPLSGSSSAVLTSRLPKHFSLFQQPPYGVDRVVVSGSLKGRRVADMLRY